MIQLATHRARSRKRAEPVAIQVKRCPIALAIEHPQRPLLPDEHERDLHRAHLARRRERPPPELLLDALGHDGLIAGGAHVLHRSVRGDGDGRVDFRAGRRAGAPLEADAFDSRLARVDHAFDRGLIEAPSGGWAGLVAPRDGWTREAPEVQERDDLVRYRRILEQRNALLRQLRQGHGGTSGDTLASFTLELARYGGRIRVARASLARSLEPLAASALGELSRGEEELRLCYLADGERLDPTTSEDQAAADLAQVLSARAAEELARGVTIAGPHRDDLEFILDGRPARTSASQGQQRSIVLATKLAEVRHVATVAGMSPVLILDDVLSELDEQRRIELLRALGAGRGAQALLSTTDAASLDGADLGEVRHIKVLRGVVEQQ